MTPSQKFLKNFRHPFLSPPPLYVLIAFPLHGEAQMKIVSFLMSRVWWGNLWWKNFPIRLFFEGCRPCNNSNLFIRSKGTLTGEYTGIQIIWYSNASNQEIDNFFSKICLVLYDLMYLPSVLFLKMFPHWWFFNSFISKLEISILYTVFHTLLFYYWESGVRLFILFFLSIPFSVKWTNIVGRNSFLVTFGIVRFEKPLLFKPWVFFFLIFLSCLLREKGLIVLWVYLTVFNLYWCDITVAVNYWDQC